MPTSGSDRPQDDRAQNDFPSPDDSANRSFTSDEDVGFLSRSMLSRLSRTIESEIVPRFMMAFDGSAMGRGSDTLKPQTLNERIEEFVELVRLHDAEVAVEYVSTLRSGGIPLPVIYLDLLAPAARRLGELWEDDRITFADVAIGTCRMHQVLLEFSRCFDSAGHGPSRAGRSALIVPAPGEQHTFGLFLVVEFLRRAGWHCWTGSPATDKDLQSLVRAQQFDAVGVSVSADRNLDQTAATIAGVRRHSKNPDTAILLGGRIVNDNPDLVTHLGADETAVDGRDAVRVLNELCGDQIGRPAT